MVFIISIINNFIIIILIIRIKLMGGPKGSQSNVRSKARKFERRIKFGNDQLDLVKHPESDYVLHLCIDSNNLYGYCTGYLSIPLDTLTHFVNAVIPKVKLPSYDVVTLFRSCALFLVT